MRRFGRSRSGRRGRRQPSGAKARRVGTSHRTTKQDTTRCANQFAVDKDLREAYCRTTFLADTPKARLALRVGQRSAQLDDLLAAKGVTTWAYMTAFNPGSRLLPVDDNARRQRELESLVSSLGFESYRGEGIGDDGQWPPEASLLVLGIGRSDAICLGQRFGQIAVVFGELGHKAELVVCEQSSRCSDAPTP